VAGAPYGPGADGSGARSAGEINKTDDLQAALAQVRTLLADARKAGAAEGAVDLSAALLLHLARSQE